MSKIKMDVFVIGLASLPVIGVAMAFLTGDAPWLILCFALCAFL